MFILLDLIKFAKLIIAALLSHCTADVEVHGDDRQSLADSKSSSRGDSACSLMPSCMTSQAAASSLSRRQAALMTLFPPPPVPGIIIIISPLKSSSTNHN